MAARLSSLRLATLRRNGVTRYTQYADGGFSVELGPLPAPQAAAVAEDDKKVLKLLPTDAAELALKLGSR